MLFAVQKYDLGREEGAVIDDWEDPQLELYHSIDRFVYSLFHLFLTLSFSFSLAHTVCP